MKILKTVILFTIVLLLNIATSYALNVDELLLDHLITKGVVTTDEAAGLRADAALKTLDEKAARKSFGIEGKTPINFGGYLQVLYNAAEGTFAETKIRRARLDFRGDVPKNTSWRIQLDAVQPLSTVISSITQNGSKDVTAKTTKAVNRPVILDAYIDYGTALGNIRIGQFFIPFSRENIESNTKLDTINRSQVTEKLVPGRDIGSQGRDIGIQIGSDIEFSDVKIGEYAAGLFNGAGINVGEDNNQKDFAGRVAFAPIDGLSIGGSYYSGKSGTTSSDKTRSGIEIVYLPSPLSIKAEYVNGKDGATLKSGWYAQFGLKLNPFVEWIAKYDSYDPNLGTSTDKTDAATLGFNYTLNKWSKIQANYEFKREETTQIDNNSLLIQSQIQF